MAQTAMLITLLYGASLCKAFYVERSYTILKQVPADQAPVNRPKAVEIYFYVTLRFFL